MIATLRGTVAAKLTNEVVLDVNGVGYEVALCTQDYGALKSNETESLYIYEHIRENSHDLFGFISFEAKQLFIKLLDVNGVGPKMALQLFNIGGIEQIKNAIVSSDTAFLCRATGVGKRVAERIIIELKDKLDGVLIESSLSGAVPSLDSDEALAGLVALGYSKDDALKALSGVDSELPVQDRIRQALRGA